MHNSEGVKHSDDKLCKFLVDLYAIVLKWNKKENLFVCFIFSPWYNRTGWPGVKHQVTFLLVIYTF